MKHTEGPWMVIDSEREDSLPGEQQVIGSRGGLVCDLMPTLTPLAIEESKSNAHLIASAPELLEACKLSLNHGNFKAFSHKHDIKKMLEDAIAKAEGR